LGHVISAKGIVVDLENIKTVMEWIVPNNVANIRSFLGLATYYHRFIKGFSKVTFPMTSLQKKGCTFQWTFKCQQSFNILEHLLTTTPVLKVVGLEKSFVVCMDSIKESVGGVLTKEGKVIAYESQILEYEQ